jgi:hypothetical protein
MHVIDVHHVRALAAEEDDGRDEEEHGDKGCGTGFRLCRAYRLAAVTITVVLLTSALTASDVDDAD